MLLITKEQRMKLIANGRVTQEATKVNGDTTDFKPVVKLFTPWTNCTWLISEMVETDGDDTVLYGLCDLGQGSPELGYVTLGELQDAKGPFGLRIERDRWFTATKTVGEYAADAREKGRVTV